MRVLRRPTPENATASARLLAGLCASSWRSVSLRKLDIGIPGATRFVAAQMILGEGYAPVKSERDGRVASGRGCSRTRARKQEGWDCRVIRGLLALCGLL